MLSSNFYVAPFAFGATKAIRRYPKARKVETARDQFQVTRADILARVSDPDKAAKAAMKLKAAMSDILDQVAAAAGGIGLKPECGT